MRVCLFLMIFLVGNIQSECPEGYETHSSLINSKFCYKYYKYGHKDWRDAKRSCRNDGGELVCFENVHERNFYSNLCPRCWVGYQWMAGKWNSESIIKSCPNEVISGSATLDWLGDCARTSQSSENKLRGESCSGDRPYICQKRNEEPQLYDGDVLRLKSWKGDYLHRPDTDQGVTTSRTEVGNLWTVVLDKNGQIQLKSWKGDFLCRSDVGQDVTTSITHTPHTSWTVIWKDDKIDLRSSKGDLLHRPASSQGVSTWSVGQPWSVEMFTNGLTYHVVSNTYRCGHVYGANPYGCVQQINKVASCENECTNFDKCMGFSEGTKCYLWPSSVSCPVGWSWITGTVTKESKSLVESSIPYYNCKVKRGKIKIPTSTKGSEIDLDATTTLKRTPSSTAEADTTTKYSTFSPSNTTSIIQRIGNAFHKAFQGNIEYILMFVGIGCGVLMLIALVTVACVKNFRSASSKATAKDQVRLEDNEKGDDNETSSLKQEPTSDTFQITPEKGEVSICNNENKTTFDVNEATKDVTVVETSENPYYEGL